MQAPFSVPALYSGKKGAINVSSGRNVVEWSPSVAPIDIGSGDGGGIVDGTVVIRLDDIAGLQASPATHAKARLRITTTSHTQFTFELPTRANLEALKAVLASANAASSSSSAAQSPSTPVTPAPATPGAASKSDPTRKLAQVLPTKGLSDADLLGSQALQMNLLKSNGDLQQQFLDAVVGQGLPADEFWRTRIPLLRMHSLVHAQRRGPYNVLATVKPVSTTQSEATGGGGGTAQVKVSLSPDKIRDIFQQYPVVRRAYDENVPPLAETAFWSRFFLSKLCRKLRGEKVGLNDAPDNVMDKYLELDEDGMTAEQRELENENAKVMRFVDVEANEMDDSQKAGNRPDITMRQTTHKDTLSIIRTINKLSQKIVGSVEGEAQQPLEEQEQLKMKELALQDLEPETAVSHIELHLHRNSDSLYSSISEKERDTVAFEANDSGASKVLKSMIDSLPSSSGPIHELLSSAVPTSSAISNAQTQVFKLIHSRRRTEQNQHSGGDSDTPAGDAGTIRDMKLSHTTAIEFLHHFWAALLSGEPSRAVTALPLLATSIEKSKTRLEAVVDRHVSSTAASDLVKLETEKRRIQGYVHNTLDALKSAAKKYHDLVEEQQAALTASHSEKGTPVGTPR
ncbi:hypothetical protein POJ06DRAFT_244977 [Lipomyces tetrasporus]|uniref:BSD domain-containing protein n=1 Tax=Lipomyces tetrasporus TaxID=54092 RepID=A0AAD7VUK5_9ASCO|nr:uncharacterized protein POJ06DRAFT_244977 [Lipomyces tetrasporus]KAJ8102548.1 hypothetical protein POJ06DRAFT_244977 [Lipomyces tetrasporus]